MVGSVRHLPWAGPFARGARAGLGRLRAGFWDLGRGEGEIGRRRASEGLGADGLG
jgi:hypothetical protein